MGTFLGPFILEDIEVTEMLKSLLGGIDEITFNSSGANPIADVLQSGSAIFGFIVRVDQAFNGVPTLTFGYGSTVLADDSMIDLGEEGLHFVNIFKELNQSVQLQAILSPGGATSGQATIFTLARA